jgi:hypothetical protein
MRVSTRRDFLAKGGALGMAGMALGPGVPTGDVADVTPGARPAPAPGVEVLDPAGRAGPARSPTTSSASSENGAPRTE